VDPQARHGHKTVTRGFDGYKGHAAVDPDSEIITDTEVTAGNVGDGAVAADLIADLISRTGEGSDRTVYGDSSYGTSAIHDLLADNDITDRCKTQPPVAADGMFSKDRFHIDLDKNTVTCPNGATASFRPDKPGDAIAYSATLATTARYARSAQTLAAVGPCASTATNGDWPKPVPTSRTRPGRPTTGPPARRSNANSPTSCATATADGEPACAAPPRSTRTSTCSPRHTTSPGWPDSDCAPSAPDGR
jgi:hypothetical protein